MPSLLDAPTDFWKRYRLVEFKCLESIRCWHKHALKLETVDDPRMCCSGNYRNQFDQSLLHRPYGVWMERVGVSTVDGLAPMQNSKQFGNSKQELPFVTIRTALERAGLQDGRAVSMLKLDVEGYEFAVLNQILEQRFEYINVCVACIDVRGISLWSQ